MTRHGRQLLIVLALWSLLCMGVAADNGITILTAGNSTYQDQAESALLSVLQQKVRATSVSRVQLSKTPAPAIPPEHLLVAIGVEATAFALSQNGEQPLLAILVPELSWRELLSAHPATNGPRVAIFVDQPTERLIHLAHLLKPDARRYGTVFGPLSGEQAGRLQRTVAAQHIELIHSTLQEDQNPIAAISPVVEASDLFIAVPDRAIFNRSIAKWVLYLSYRKKIPVIGFSRSYTEAGALASVYSNPVDIGRQGGERVAQWLTIGNEGLNGDAYPIYYQVLTNPTVARSLGIRLPGNEALEHDLQALENKALVTGP